MSNSQDTFSENEIINKILSLLASEGLMNPNVIGNIEQLTKENIRMMHSPQRKETVGKESIKLIPNLNKLLKFFAAGNEITPTKIEARLVPVNNSQTALLFRLATLLWSVPVSKGFGRRMRFLIIDSNNDKLIGIFALGDPVFNLTARDSLIGWNTDDRKARLVNVMDAYVVGAVPPYNMLLGGKLVASLIGSQEVVDYYLKKYEGKRGIISNQVKDHALALITVTSALGRSSIYNRLKIPGIVNLIKIGQTKGYGHFQISNELFDAMRELLIIKGHSYALGYEYGSGPNWKWRVIRQALKYSGVSIDVLKHGIAREIYAMPIASNWKEYLQGSDDFCLVSRPSVKDISEACLNRWVVPRAERLPNYAEWTHQNTIDLFNSILSINGNIK
ncbi:hypothetical protein ASZ90_017350 [hydrocarbon metagenome]|uniref:Uncharacterized protein n=1 Tax=hydrocarbon metagenome TaxID=938273 RepID=A0A0W8E9W5_9ZZZZ